MSISRIAICLTTFIVLAIPMTKSQAQREIHHVPPLIDSDGYNPDFLHPFIEPLAFDPDWQFFAPAEVGEFGGGPDLNTGWFSSYTKLYLWVTRPEDQSALTTQFNLVGQTVDRAVGGDFAWGNRYEVGYMTDEDHGWHGSLWRISGPHAEDVLTQERINVVNLTEETNTNFDPNSIVNFRGGGMGGGGGGGNNMMMARMFRDGIPVIDGNDPQTGQRDYRITNSINSAQLSSFELNKTFRMKPRTYGSTMEPFFGFRYIKFDNLIERQSYNRFDPATGLALSGPIPIDPIVLTTFTVEQLTRSRASFENYMVGGQFGFRWYKQKSRWNLSSELRAFAFQNFQSFTSLENTETTHYTDTTVGGPVTAVFLERQKSVGHDTEFVFGGEIRADAAFEITRDVSIQVGFNFMELARGVGRGRTVQANDEDVTIVGGSFGFVINR
jgi:hypothetical protein